MRPDHDDHNSVYVAVEGGWQILRCLTCSKEFGSQQMAQHHKALMANHDDFLLALLHDKQRIMMYLYQGCEIRDDRGQTVLRVPYNTLSKDRDERLDQLHRAIGELFCVRCERRLATGDDAVCHPCREAMTKALSGWTDA